MTPSSEVRFPATSKYQPAGMASFTPLSEKLRNWYPPDNSTFGTV
jgi:hypothetical protein